MYVLYIYGCTLNDYVKTQGYVLQNCILSYYLGAQLPFLSMNLRAILFFFFFFCFSQPRPTKGRMRIHCLENVDKALQFLKEQKVHLENMGSHDIVDGNHRLTLGLIWTIILRFQVELMRSCMELCSCSLCLCDEKTRMFKAKLVKM